LVSACNAQAEAAFRLRTNDQGVLTLSEGLDDQCESEKSEKEKIELFKAGEHAAVALESSGKPFDFIALTVNGPVILPKFQAIAFGWNGRNEAEILCQMVGFIVFVSFVHDQVQRCPEWTDAAQQLFLSRGSPGNASNDVGGAGCLGCDSEGTDAGSAGKSGYCQGGRYREGRAPQFEIADMQ